MVGLIKSKSQRGVSSTNLHDNLTNTKQLPLSPSNLSLAPSPSSSSSANVKIKLVVEQPHFLAGSSVKGFLELAVGAKDFALGEIGVEFSGYQELKSLDHTSTRRILVSQISFQGPNLPPSNAVSSVQPPVFGGSYYPALLGRTRFAFEFPLPKEVPSTSQLGGNATTRYELRGFVNCVNIQKGEVEIKSDKLAVAVVERWGEWRTGNWTEAVERKTEGKLKLAGEGKVEVKASVGKVSDEARERGARDGRLFWRREREKDRRGNGKIEVEVTIKNLSRRSVSGLKLALCRRLRVLPKLSASGSPIPMNTTAPVVMAIVNTDHFRGIGFDFPPGEERDVTLSTEVPVDDECWTVRKGTLFELDVFLRLEVECGFLSKDLTVDLPIFIAHPSSLPPSAHAAVAEPVIISNPTNSAPLHPQIYQQHAVYPQQQQQVLLPTSGPPFPTPGHEDPAALQSFTYPYASPSHLHQTNGAHTIPLHQNSHHQPAVYPLHSLAQQQQFNEFGAAYPQQIPHPPPSPSPAPAAYQPPVSDDNAYYYQHQGPVGTLPYSPSHHPHQTIHTQPGYIAFDPSVPLDQFTQSKFLGAMAYRQPGQVSVAGEVMDGTVNGGSRPPSRSGSMAGFDGVDGQHQFNPYHPQLQQHFQMPPPPPPAPQELLTASSSAPAQYQTMQKSPHLSSVPPEHNGGPERPLSARGDHQPHSTSSPTPADPEPYYSASARATSPSKMNQELTPTPRPVPLHKTHSMSSVRSLSLRTPPPRAPSAGAAGMAEVSDEMLNLETIGEDGESQAGTVKSVAGLTGLGAAGNPGAVNMQGPSPKNSPGGRSSVQDLEEMADMEEEAMERNRSLPPPPVPSDRTKPGKGNGGMIRAQDIFSSRLGETETSTPENPLQPGPVNPEKPKNADATSNTIPARTSRSVSPLKREEGGLHRLEALLNRPVTPDVNVRPLSPASRPISPTAGSGSASSRPLSPSIASAARVQSSLASPASPAIGALRAKSISRASSERQLARQIALEDPQEEVSKALEKGPPELRLRTRNFHAPVINSSSPTPEATVTKSDEVTVEVTKPSFTRSTSTSSSSPLLTAGKFSDRIVDGRKVVDVKEMDGLKKDALGRVGGWLADTNPDSPVPWGNGKKKARDELAALQKPVSKTPSPPSKRHTIDFARPAPALSASVAEPSVEELLAAADLNTSSSAPSSPPSTPTRRLKATNGGLQVEDGDLADKYCVRSARGGRGGVVSSVAGIWAEKIEVGKRELTSIPPPLAVVPKVLKIQSGAGDPAPRPLAPVQQNGRNGNGRSLRSMMDDVSPPPPLLSPSSSSRSLAGAQGTPTPAPKTNAAPATLVPRITASVSSPALAARKWGVEPSPLAKPFVNTTMGRPPVISRSATVTSFRDDVDGQVKPIRQVGGGIKSLIEKYSKEVGRT
ncbi:hypothetical protein T439DRAFT_328365 [Meredithblackwellia eburnea MCA 4105]